MTRLSESTIVVPGMASAWSVGDNMVLTATGLKHLNLLVMMRCEQQWPGDRFLVIPGGPANEVWDWLINRNGCVTAEAVGIENEVSAISEAVYSGGDWDPSWTEPIKDEEGDR